MAGGSACCIPGVAKTALAAATQIVDTIPYDGTWDSDVIQLAGGKSTVGTDAPVILEDGEGPARSVSVKPFGILRVAVTNEMFANFVEATGYVTEAERFGWSLVFWSFTAQEQEHRRVAQTPWWCRVDGADWAHPFGPGSSIDDIADHPVTHVSWHDAMACAAWMGGRLPTESEWEHAAQGGGTGPYPWGTAEPTNTVTPCNIWQGRFPDHNTAVDGHLGTAPADSFAPNGYGVYNMAGNVWEWAAEPFRIRSLKRTAKLRNQVAAAQHDKLLKGGSYLCHKSYCYRYRIAARTAATADSSTGHTGFRVVFAPDADEKG